MNKIKFICFAIGIVLSVAFTKPACFECTSYQQYRFDGANYWSVSSYGLLYYCIDAPSTCTYYRPNPFQPNYYVPCREGKFDWVE